MDSSRSAPRASRTRSVTRLGDAHEAVERWLERAASRAGPADALAWEHTAQRLHRLLEVERALLVKVRLQRSTAPVAATLDPLRVDHRSELDALFREAAARAAAGAPWPAVLGEIADFLAWTFIAVEESLAGG